MPHAQLVSCIVAMTCTQTAKLLIKADTCTPHSSPSTLLLCSLRGSNTNGSNTDLAIRTVDSLLTVRALLAAAEVAPDIAPCRLPCMQLTNVIAARRLWSDKSSLIVSLHYPRHHRITLPVESSTASNHFWSLGAFSHSSCQLWQQCGSADWQRPLHLLCGSVPA